MSLHTLHIQPLDPWVIRRVTLNIQSNLHPFPTFSPAGERPGSNDLENLELVDLEAARAKKIAGTRVRAVLKMLASEAGFMVNPQVRASVLCSVTSQCNAWCSVQCGMCSILRSLHGD
jgi:hypothetical protein